MHSGDAQLFRAHTQLWMAVRAERVMAAAFMGEAVSTENDSPILLTAVSSAPVWYHHAHILICITHRFSPEKPSELYLNRSELVYLYTCLCERIYNSDSV